MKIPLLLYNLLIVLVIIVAGLIGSQPGQQRLFSLLFIPVALYFFRQLTTSFRLPATVTGTTAGNKLATKYWSKQIKAKTNQGQVLNPEVLSDSDIADINRRLFLKLIGSAGLATFTFSLFTKRTHAAFFGSMPGPGTIAIKDSNDNIIDPAEKQPTDGYEVTDVDDDTIPAYYGFVNKDGHWYIAREDADGSFRYHADTTTYTTDIWDSRESLSYSLFSDAF